MHFTVLYKRKSGFLFYRYDLQRVPILSLHFFWHKNWGCLFYRYTLYILGAFFLRIRVVRTRPEGGRCTETVTEPIDEVSVLT